MKVRNTRAVGAIIRERRRELGLDQLTLANRIGASRYWVVQIEQGKDSAEIGRVLRALEALDLTVDISISGAAATRQDVHKESRIPIVDIDAIIERARQSPAALRKQSKAARKQRVKSGKDE